MSKYFPALQHINAPNLITSVGLAFGIAACYHMTQGRLQSALVYIFFAMVMDLIDGFVASKFNRQTTFGKYMDTLVDFFICCVMPVLMVFNFVQVNALLIGALTFYCICGLWRLAHYNVTAAENRNFFRGLPVPGAMSIVTLATWSVVNYDLQVWICAVAFALAGVFMISNIKLRKYGFWQKALWVVGVAFIILVVASS